MEDCNIDPKIVLNPDPRTPRMGSLVRKLRNFRITCRWLTRNEGVDPCSRLYITHYNSFILS